MSGFEDFNLGSEVLKALKYMNFKEPTEIQKTALPVVFQGVDIIGQAKTGTGKTAVFGIYLVETLERYNVHPQSIILAPTRELAIQITQEIRKIAKFTPIEIVTIYGGASINIQMKQLKDHPHIIVGTPGRVLDHLNRGTLDLSNISCAVVDEADRMLDMGFIEDVSAILKKCPENKQVLLFSATMPEAILRLSKEFQKNPETLKVSADEITITHITHKFIGVNHRDRFGALYSYLKKHQPKHAIIFCRTKFLAERLSNDLHKRDYRAMSLHGNLSQNKREMVVRKMREAKLQIVVATDLAARGLDIDNITHVINFNLPDNPLTYTHRVGRTGRAGRGGSAFTIVANDEMGMLGEIERVCGIKMEEEKLEIKSNYRNERSHQSHGGSRPRENRGSGSYDQRPSGSRLSFKIPKHMRVK